MMTALLEKWPAVILAALFVAGSSTFAGGANGQRRSLNVSTRDDLVRLVDSAIAGTTILLKDGTYNVRRALVFRKPDVCIRSASGNRDKVILDGRKRAGRLRRKNCVNEVIAIRSSDITVADISICHARDHGIHIWPQQQGHIRNVVMHNIHVYDCGQQLIKVNSNGGKPLYWVDEGVLEESLIEFIDNSIMQAKGRYFYTGGLDIHGGRNWRVCRNTFRNIQRDDKLMEHAVHMWSRCRGTIVEQNRFIDCFRAVGFGMRREVTGFVRDYSDGKGNKPYFGHVGGVVRNNSIFNRMGIHLESGIELTNVIDVKVYHNTVVSHDKPFSSIEYRGPNTRVTIVNNIVSQRIRKRNDAKATLTNNIENVTADFFKDYKMGDLHLSSNASQAVDKGAPLADTGVKVDIDGDKRDARPDIGADERRRR